MINFSLVWSRFTISSPCTATVIWLGGEFLVSNPVLAYCLRRGSFFCVFSAGGDLLQILLASHIQSVPTIRKNGEIPIRQWHQLH